MKKLLAIILCASIVSPAFVFAGEKAEQKIDNDYRKSAQMVDKNEKRESHKEKGGEEKGQLKDQKKAQKQVELVVRRIESAIERVQKLSNRVSERLNKLEADGFDVATSRAYLTEATKKLDDVRIKVATLKIGTVTPLATTTQMYDLKNIRSSVKDIVRVLHGAHKNVAQAISSAKPGQNKPDPVATSTVVITEVSTTTIADATI